MTDITLSQPNYENAGDRLRWIIANCLVALAKLEGDPAAVDEMAMVMTHMAALLHHVAGRDRLIQELGAILELYDIGGDDEVPGTH